MKPIPDCIPDALAMVLAAAREVSEDSFIHRKVLALAMQKLLESGNFGDNPAELTLDCLLAAYKALGVRDPYEKVKARSVKAFLGLEKKLQTYVESKPDWLAGALGLSFVGAMTQSDILGRAEAEKELPDALSRLPARDEQAELVRALDKAKTVMIVLNRAGEAVFDKLLARELSERDKKVTLAVVSRPILSMATAEDAEAAGLGEYGEIMDPGAAMLGLSIAKASVAFRERFEQVDVVLAKGETHYAELASAERPVWFVMKVVSGGVAKELAVAPGEGVVVRGGESETRVRSPGES